MLCHSNAFCYHTPKNESNEEEGLTHLMEKCALLGILVGKVKNILLEAVVGQELVRLPSVFVRPHLLCLLQIPLIQHGSTVTLRQAAVQPDGKIM